MPACPFQSASSLPAVIIKARRDATLSLPAQSRVKKDPSARAISCTALQHNLPCSC